MAAQEDYYDEEQNEEEFEEGFIHFPDDQDFGTWVQEQLRRTPWLLASIFIHVFILMLAVIMAPAGGIGDDSDKISASAQLKPKQLLEEPPPDEIKADKLIKDKVNVEDPVISEKQDEVNETDNDEEWEQAKGDPDNMS
ncbi:hypothetical protein ACFL54_07680, partial [Planctomycetota bacterium]